MSKTLDYNRDIEIDYIIPNLRSNNKKAVLSTLADRLSEAFKLPAPLLLDRLIMNESLNSSGIGEGIAIPALILKNIRHSYTLLVKLETPILFDAIDEQPVDIICLVVSPEAEGPYHLRRLSRITRLLKNQDLISKIRATSDSDTINALLHNPDGWMMAA